MTADLVIFDLDGTLIDSTADLTTGVNRTLAELGLPAHTVDEVRTFIGDGAWKLMARALPEPLQERLDEIVARFREHYAEVSTAQTRVYEGVDELLGALAGVPTALCTNKPVGFLPDILERFGWTGRFSPILGGDSVPAHKPDPAMLLRACEAHGVAPGRAVMVGDGPQDIQAAVAAGMPVCAVSWGFRDRSLLEQHAPTWLIDAPRELVAIVRGRA